MLGNQRFAASVKSKSSSTITTKARGLPDTVLARLSKHRKYTSTYKSKGRGGAGTEQRLHETFDIQWILRQAVLI